MRRNGTDTSGRVLTDRSTLRYGGSSERSASPNGALENDRRDTMAHERFPTLRETRSARPEAEAQAEPETGVERDELAKAEEAMKTVLAENERLKRHVLDLEDRLHRVTVMYNNLVAKQRRKGAHRG
jgi:hypothetical protein